MFKSRIGLGPVFAYAWITSSRRGGVAGTQLALVMLAAPAGTAGAICVDRATGTLTHMLMTDLSSVEIVLGKLVARMVSILCLLAGTLPMMELLTSRARAASAFDGGCAGAPHKAWPR